MKIIMTNGNTARTFATCRDITEANVLIRYFGYSFIDEQGESWQLSIGNIDFN